MYDVLIIGAGPGGYSAANKASINGLKVALFEKDLVGIQPLFRQVPPTLSFSNINNESATLFINSLSWLTTIKAFLCTVKIYSFVTVKNNIHKITIIRMRIV